MTLVAIPRDAWKRGVNWHITGWHVFVHVCGFLGLVVAWPALIEQLRDVGTMLLFAYFATANWDLHPLVAGWSLVPPASPLLHALLGIEVLAFACHLSIRLGVHSLYTHRAYKAAYVWHLCMVLVYSANLQGPVLWWSAKHELHHRGGTKDPYSVADGVFWAHMLWTCFNSAFVNYGRVVPWLVIASDDPNKGLRASVVKLLYWQQKHWVGLGVLLGIALPWAALACWVGPVHGFLLVILRLLCQNHFTWQINSLSHLVGPQTYDTRDSSHDSPWWLLGIPSLLSVGEAGGHNFHHRYKGSFWISYVDPGAWVLLLVWAIGAPLRWVGLPGLRLVWDLIYVDRHGRTHTLH